VRRTRPGSLGSVLPVSLVEPDGLIVTTDGRYVRVIECDRVPNTITADPPELQRIEDCFAHLCRIIPDRQGLVVLAQTDPVPIHDALAADVRATEIAAARDRLAGQPALAAARLRLMAATRQTVRAAAGAEQPAVAARWWVLVPYRPVIDDSREQLRAMAAGARGRTLLETHCNAAVESSRLIRQVEAVLRRAGIDTWLLDGTQALSLLWERLHPAAELAEDEEERLLEQLAAACEVADATSLDEASEARHRILGAICGSPRAAINIGEHPAWLRHEDGTLEETIHLATPPLVTDASWLAHLLSCPLPATLAVHIGVGVRSREKHRQRRRWQRLRAAVRYKERRDRLVGSDEEDALEEAAVMDAELAAQVGATVYEVGIYCSLRDPRGDAESFDRVVKQTCSDFHALTNARVVRGRHLALQGFTATLPLGIDPLRAVRRYAQRNIAHCVPLTSSRCGCPGGLILGTADPGGTIERLDPYDRQFATTLTLIVGKGGGGKTVTSILLACRFIAQGGRIYITDRSATPDDRGDGSGTGHYDTLLSLIPGGRRVQLGTAHGAVICPWDVPDVEHVPDQKLEFLLALHALLIGEAHDPEGLVRTLDADEEALLRDAITAVYARCAEHRERPREQLLIDALRERHLHGQLTGANADKLQSLLLRLGPYGETGTLAHIADAPTTVDEDAPIVLFDFTGLSDRLAPALTLAVADYVEWHVHRLRRARVAGELDGHGPWAGKSQLIIEEGWKPLSSPAAGAWLNEYARRARHYALWLTFITQFFRDFDSEQGRSMLSNHAVALCLPNERRDLEHARDSLALTDTDIAEITSLPSQKGSYSTLYMISKRGRGAVRVAPGAPEYWVASSNPELDQPLRHAALKETGGDPWKALTRLCDPAWHEQRQRQAIGAAR
jgi:hypothetical protein